MNLFTSHRKCFAAFKNCGDIVCVLVPEPVKDLEPDTVAPPDLPSLDLETQTQARAKKVSLLKRLGAKKTPLADLDPVVQPEKPKPVPRLRSPIKVTTKTTEEAVEPDSEASSGKIVKGKKKVIETKKEKEITADVEKPIERQREKEREKERAKEREKEMEKEKPKEREKAREKEKEKEKPKEKERASSKPVPVKQKSEWDDDDDGGDNDVDDDDVTIDTDDEERYKKKKEERERKKLSRVEERPEVVQPEKKKPEAGESEEETDEETSGEGASWHYG